MPAKQVSQISGHSVRVGAAQDLLAPNIDLASSDAGGQVEIDPNAQCDMEKG